MHNLLVDDNKSAKNFKKLSKNASEKLNNEKNVELSDLKAPKFQRNNSSDMVLKKGHERSTKLESSVSTQEDPFNLDLDSIPGFENIFDQPLIPHSQMKAQSHDHQLHSNESQNQQLQPTQSYQHSSSKPSCISSSGNWKSSVSLFVSITSG